MNKLLTFIVLMLFSVLAFAQPANDDCSGIIDLGTAPICPSPSIYTNLNATESNIGNDNFPSCFNGAPARDVWFQFTATAGIEDYVITVNGITDGLGSIPMLMPQIALYRGDICAIDELVILDCADAVAGEASVSLLASGLTAGITYYLRINDWTLSVPNWGSFSLCVEEFVQTVYTIDEGSTTVCSGELYDTGGPNGDYGNNENFIFTICPDDPHTCINFTLSNYNVENGDDIINFYDGDNIFAPQIGEIDGGANGQNHGGVCYSVTATSGCLTVQFSSDGFLNYEGFAGSWECSNDCPESSPLNVSPNPTFADIEAALQNPLMDISVTNINCPNDALGTFEATDDTGLGINDGLLLTTGRAADAANPATTLASTNHGATGDPDLNYLQNTYGSGFGQIGDACTVEMDVTPKWGNIGFDYVFGSDEYKQNFSQFSNDLMAIMISGPGIPGMPGLNNQEHLTFLPGNALIQIQTVNASTRWEYYRNNEENQNLVYNGLTSDFLGERKYLVASRSVTPCQTYQVKMAIGDTDPDDDSGLFVRPTQDGIPIVSVEYLTGIDYLVEGCTDIENLIDISLPNPISTTLVFQVQVGGTATKNIDYTASIPPQIIIQPGETGVQIPISIINDNVVEGTETIELTLVTNLGCGDVVFSSTTIEIEDELKVEISPEQDTIFVCDGIFTADLVASGAASYEWTPNAVFDNPNNASTTATISNDQTVTVTGTLGTCSDTDEVFLQIVSPQINIDQTSTTICEGEPFQLTSTNNVGDEGLVWSPAAGLDDPNSPNPIASPNFTTTYTLTVETETGGCTATDEITITVEPFDFPEITVTDTLICQNSSVLLAEPVFNSSTTFEWSPTDGLNSSTIANATATPDVSTTYTLMATSLNGVCTEEATVNIDVFPADVEITNPDTVYLCLGDTIALSSITSTSGLGLTWSPVDSLSSTTDETVLANPMFSTWYFATLEVGDCIVSDSVFIQVDSLPDLSIQAIPAKESYCEGEIVSLASTGYAVSKYPDISHAWIPAPGAISEDTLLNLVINATETTIYTRYTVNGACEDTAQFEVIVVPTAEITITPDNPTVCPGETIQLFASSPDITEFEWSPSNGLSCDDCPDPVVNPPGSITYQVSGEFMGCPANAVVTVTEEQGPNFALTSTRKVCDGESVVLNTVEDPAATYTWTLADGTVFSNDPMPTVVVTEDTEYFLSIQKGDCPPTETSITIRAIKEMDLNIAISDSGPICFGDEVDISVQIDSPNGTYAWLHDASLSGPNITEMPPVGTTTYTAIFTSAQSDETNTICFTDEADITIEVRAPFNIDSLVADPECVFEGEEIALEAITTPSVLNGPTYTWSRDDGTQYGDTFENFISVVAATLENQDSIPAGYTVVIVDEAGCRDQADVEVTVKNSFIELPNAFTPDNDDMNETFNLLRSGNVEVLDFKIWNRWGQIVYDNDSNEVGWDGTKDGEPVASDVYVYSIRYQFGAIEETLKGDVTLLR